MNGDFISWTASSPTCWLLLSSLNAEAGMGFGFGDAEDTRPRSVLQWDVSGEKYMVLTETT